MRYAEIASGMRVHVSSEEQELLDVIGKEIAQDNLDERGEELARQMIARGLVNRFKKDDKIFLRPNSMMDIWRDRDG
jgi:hypothetical protein